MNRITNFILWVFALLCISCCSLNKVPTSNVDIKANDVKVILITIDGARWQDVFNGTDATLNGGDHLSAQELLPNLYHYFVTQGIVVGSKSLMTASNSAHVSLPGYLEIMRGYATFDCTNNRCDPHLTTTIADYFNQATVFSSWDTIKKTISSHSDNMVVNCGRSYRSNGWRSKDLLDDQTFDASNFSYDPLYRPDQYTQKYSIEYFTNYHPDFLWVALGDTDEWAHMGNYTKYMQALQSADQFIGRLLKDPQINNYTIIVTVDHGRSSDWTSHGRDSESSRVWLMMRGPQVPSYGFVTYSGTMSLANILPTILGLLNNESYENSLLYNLIQ